MHAPAHQERADASSCSIGLLTPVLTRMELDALPAEIIYIYNIIIHIVISFSLFLYIYILLLLLLLT